MANKVRSLIPSQIVIFFYYIKVAAEGGPKSVKLFLNSPLVETINQIESVSVLKMLLRQAITIGSVEEFQLFLEQQLASGDKEEGA
ncbi:MAG: hypothetical protein WBM44_30420 [Waterburya sp.]